MRAFVNDYVHMIDEHKFRGRSRDGFQIWLIFYVDEILDMELGYVGYSALSGSYNGCLHYDSVQILDQNGVVKWFTS